MNTILLFTWLVGIVLCYTHIVRSQITKESNVFVDLAMVLLCFIWPIVLGAVILIGTYLWSFLDNGPHVEDDLQENQKV
ncbi:hypothetical protein HN858_02030 [Candidatus Falkowbacteria bacterium]|nr:hypothetical protein [Candidatus Falkowbacteria bacterium]MBT5503589.1 hypothetical protein [Candidatus Falkowbacteria bacterium]MBT6573989.1 hypothetical protein [Candidatus Falkowbacteria bacterium]MBT7348434.1 hypothetical protein [Candidatus Falkowbacteria bacterium]MBT7500612.1 hypothetical protein [Candidatus Falkowbacteria bacterium]